MRSYKKIAQDQDKRVAEASGLRIRPNSGAISGHKGDLGGPNVFIETKTRVKSDGFLHLDTDWLIKARKQAQSMGKPSYGLVVSPGDGRDFFITCDDLRSSGESYEPDYWFMTKTFRLGVEDILFKLYQRRKIGGVIRIHTKIGRLVLMDLDHYISHYRT